MNRSRRDGFTLIELLTVIAIIGILAGLTFTVIPQFLERAKVTRVKSSMAQINTALTQYFAQNNTFPAGYGFKRATPDGREQGEGISYWLQPYTVPLRIHGIEDMYDSFSSSYDVNDNGMLNLMEFLPIGNPTQDAFNFPTARYTGNNLEGEVNLQLNTQPRPMVYAPVNARQFAIARKYWQDTNQPLALNWDRGNDALATLRFPPASYDAFVLISVGPGGTTGGVVANLPNGVNATDDDAYHIAALRTYFLATRDLNNNNVLDFEFEARSRSGEAGNPGNETLPDGKPLYGPLIYVSK